VIISCAQNISKSYKRILIKFCEEVGRDQRTNRLYFGGDPIQDSDPEIFYCPARLVSVSVKDISC